MNRVWWVLSGVSFLLALFLGAAQARAENAPANRGWILFSWQTNRGWQYSLLPNQGKDKRWADINLIKVHGWDALKGRLKNIHPGEHLAYGSKEEIRDVPRERLMEVPRTEIRHLIRKFAKDRGFEVGSPLPPAKSTISD